MTLALDESCTVVVPIERAPIIGYAGRKKTAGWDS